MPSSFDLENSKSTALAQLLTQNRAQEEMKEREIQAAKDKATQEQVDKMNMLAEQRRIAEEIYKLHGGKVPVNVEGFSIGARDPLDGLRAMLLGQQVNTPKLTPAQVAAEGAAGKQITEYNVAGGKAVLDKDLQQVADVQEEIVKGKRDNYDRIVGGALSTSPTLMGLFAPKEKARRDRVRNSAISIAKATDPNPTEKQIEAIYSQVYDSSAPDTELIQRIGNFHKAQKGKAAQLDEASRRYKDTGYATLGGAPAAPAARVKVSNGAETLEIDASDLPNAEADGYRRVE